MKLPATINIKYIGNSDLPIMTVDSTHVVSEIADLDVIADYVSLFSVLDFTASDIENCIAECQSKHVCNFKNDHEWLSFSLI